MKIGYFVDWLELYCIEPRGIDFLQKLLDLGYRIETMPYTTRIYSQVVQISDYLGFPVCTVCRLPLSVKNEGRGGILPVGSCHVKFHNSRLYQENLGGYVMDFLKVSRLFYKQISRIDLCADFQHFFNGLAPSTLIQGFAAGKYLKIGQPNFSLHGSTASGYNKYNSMMFGSKTSNIYTRFYDKSQEMIDVSQKNYICDCWRALGFDMDSHVWRVEFAVHGDGMRCFDKKTAEVRQIEVLELCSRDKIRALFLSLSKKYFVFSQNKKGVRKYLQTKLNLFDPSINIERWAPLPTCHDGHTNRTDKIVFNYLQTEAMKSHLLTTKERLELLRVAKSIEYRKDLIQYAKWKLGTQCVDLPMESAVLKPSERLLDNNSEIW